MQGEPLKTWPVLKVLKSFILNCSRETLKHLSEQFTVLPSDYYFSPTEEAFKGGSEEQHLMNNVRRTLVKTYGISFPVVKASGIKHFRSPAAGKIKQNLLFKHVRRFLGTFVIPLRAMHMFRCVFKTKPALFYPPPRNERRGNLHWGSTVHHWFIRIKLKEKKNYS